MIHRLPVDDDDEAAPTTSTPAGPAGLLPRGAADLRAATALLTRVPVGTRPTSGTGSRSFAIVGGLVGAAGFVPIALFGAAVPSVAAILALAVMAVLSGGLHLDGLADTTDALVAAGPDAAERARRDPRIGPAGAIALVLTLGLEAASLTQLVARAGVLAAGIVCVVAASAARVVPVVLSRLERGQAGVSGLGAWFAARITSRDAVVATSTGVVVSIVGALAASTPTVAAVGIAGLIAGLGLGIWLVRVRGQLDGDVLGASVELALAAALVAAVVVVH
jgi:adenosylcobinamide-GDP ribazoletransferase